MKFCILPCGYDHNGVCRICRRRRARRESDNGVH